MSKYQGISLDLTSPDTGAVATFHRIGYIQIDDMQKTSTVIVMGYVSKETYQKALQPISRITCTVTDIPPDSADIRDWLYERITAPAPKPDPNAPMQPQQNVYAGATLVTE